MRKKIVLVGSFVGFAFIIIAGVSHAFSFNSLESTSLSMSSQVIAQAPPPPPPPPPLENTGNKTVGSFDNPIKSKTFGELVVTIAQILTTVGIPLVAIFIVYAGFLFVTAQGDPKKLETAKATLYYAIIGGVVIIGAYAISTAIVNFAKAL